MDEHIEDHDGGLRIPSDRDTEREREGLHDAPGHTAEHGSGPDLGIEDPSKVEVDAEGQRRSG